MTWRVAEFIRSAAARSPGSTSLRARANALRAPPAVAIDAPELNVLQDAQCVRHQHGKRVVAGDQVVDDRLLVDAHEPHAQAGFVLVDQAGLAQADDALVRLAGPH